MDNPLHIPAGEIQIMAVVGEYFDLPNGLYTEVYAPAG